jgi:hypothetical protein
VHTYVAKEPFDVVCSHNFLSRFRAEERPRLIGAGTLTFAPAA